MSGEMTDAFRERRTVTRDLTDQGSARALDPDAGRTPARRRPMISVAIVGPDGAGKTTITQRLEQQPLPAPVKRIYMGVNLEASSLMLPTTRLALAIKRARGRRSDMVAPSGALPATTGGRGRRVIGGITRVPRLAMWLAEEWFRQLVAEYHRRRGSIVVFDRHFYADYYDAGDVAGGASSATSRLHRYLLEHAYPKPDLVICLDAPGRVLFDRKHEASVEWLERRRGQYLRLGTVVTDFAVVDVDRPLDDVVADVALLIAEFVEKRQA
jgi:thymidylate kinase